ncbi:MAG: glycosyltransferase [Candidatus Brocadiia bacterium]
MRVLVTSHACVVEANRRKLDLLARKDDVELALICPRTVRRELGTYRAPRASPAGYRIEALPALYASHTYRFFYLGAGRAIRRLAPDVVHVEEEPWSLAAWQAVRACRRLAGTRVLCFTWQNLPVRYGWPHEAIRRRVLAAADAAIAGNAEAAGLLREGGFEGPVHVLPQFGVDPERYAPRDESPLRRELGLQGLVAGFAGRLVPEKGVELLLDALAGLAGEWSVLVVGRGPLRDGLAARLAKPPFAGRSALVEAVPRDQMPRYLNAMDLLALPSRAAAHWKEQFGHVLIEAMACQVPVVGSTCGAIPEVVGDAGMVVPEGQADALREAIERLMGLEEERAELGRRGRQRVLERYTDACIADATHAIYREVLGR